MLAAVRWVAVDLLLILVLVARETNGWWHPYDFNKQYPPECNRSANASRTEYGGSLPTAEQIQAWKLWPGVISSYDRKHGESMANFVKGLEAVWKHQHPADCSKAKFLIEGGWEEGFGSETHVMGAGLGLAMNLGRVYLMNNPHGLNQIKLENRYGFEINTTFCRSQKKFSLECYYEPWSSCTIEDALKSYPNNDLYSLTEIDPESDNYPSKDYLSPQYTSQQTLRVRLTPFMSTDSFLPKPLRLLFTCSPIRMNSLRYWWRAVAAAYMLRPNAATLGLLHKFREPLAFDPEQESCVSVYIRRGDKHQEMKLEDDFSVFFDTAAILWESLPQRDGGSNHHGREGADSHRQPTMFLGSEDPAVIEAAQAWTAKHGWRLLSTNLFDRRSVSTWLNYQQQAEQWEKRTIQHHDLEYLSMILNLDMHLRCSAFVSTANSNWSRIGDELRATVGGKANAHLAEIDCPANPPCIDRSIPIQWRRGLEQQMKRTANGNHSSLRQ